MSVKVFRSDRLRNSESDYGKWLSDNPEGFVVNTLKSTSGQGNKSDALLWSTKTGHRVRVFPVSVF